LVHIEVEHCGFQIGNALLKCGVRGERQAALDSEAQDEV
jgi:hypothetical protein